MRHDQPATYIIFTAFLLLAAPVACIDESCTRNATCETPDASDEPSGLRDSGIPEESQPAELAPSEGDGEPDGVYDSGVPVSPDPAPPSEDSGPAVPPTFAEDAGFLNIADLGEATAETPWEDAGGSSESDGERDSGSPEKATADAGRCADGGCEAESTGCVPSADSDCCEPEESRSCAEGGALGACAGGTQTCAADGHWSSCTVVPASSDGCWLGADDNCDGVANSPLDASCECREGDVECVSEAPTAGFHVCSSAGTWEDTVGCPYVCSDGQCAGECVPGARVCNGNVPSACDEFGAWQVEDECSPGTPCQGAGECLECPEGSFASGGQCLPFANCAPGQYVASEGTSTADRVCSTCPSGSFSLATNAATCETWTSCGPGTFAQSAGTSTSDRGCAACAPGTFSATDNAAACVPCGPDSFASDPFATTCQPWKSCVAGTYILTQGTSTADRVCEECGAGTYSVGSNRGKCTEWSECDPGEMTDAVGTAIADRTCKPIESCVDLDTTCGPDESCCTSLLVPGGSFYQNSQGEQTTTISDVRIDKYEVTVGRFRKFFEAWEDGYRPAAGEGKHEHLNDGDGLRGAAGVPLYETGWDVDWEGATNLTDTALTLGGSLSTWQPSAGPTEEFPVNTVLWAEAYAFCIWDGGFLPTSAELNYAGAGGSQQRYYPWSVPAGSNEISADDANYGCLGDGYPGCTKGDPRPVGGKPAGAGPYGHLDLAGSVAEWVLDSPFPAVCTDCASLQVSGENLLRGGSFQSNATSVTTSSRQTASRTFRSPDFGFRCARIP
jgi:formylglycine-generating enzyme